MFVSSGKRAHHRLKGFMLIKELCCWDGVQDTAVSTAQTSRCSCPNQHRRGASAPAGQRGVNHRQRHNQQHGKNGATCHLRHPPPVVLLENRHRIQRRSRPGVRTWHKISGSSRQRDSCANEHDWVNISLQTL